MRVVKILLMVLLYIIAGAAILGLVFGLHCLEALVFKLLFNWVVSLFHGTFQITFWQSFGVCLLLSFIGGFFKLGSKARD